MLRVVSYTQALSVDELLEVWVGINGVPKFLEMNDWKVCGERNDTYKEKET